MNREQFFQELRTALHREGFTPQPEQDELLPVEWDGLPLCRITADGGVRYWQEDVATPERERACERATDLACTVREYMTLLEQAPPLQAQSLTGDYRLLADFNGAVLAAHPTRLGVQFVTWDWSFDRTGLNYGRYAYGTHEGIVPKEDFEKANALMKSRAQKITLTKNSPYAFRKKIVCGDCQSLFRRKVVRGITYWVCIGHDKKRHGIKCGITPIAEDEITNAFIRL